MKQCAAWVTDFRRSLTSRLLKALFAREILGSQKLFISNVAHELRTPLSVIKTASEVALLEPGLTRDTRKAFNEITEELARVSEILDNLLSLNTLSGEGGMKFQNLDLSAVVEDVAKRLLPLARELGVRVRVRTKAGSIAVGNRAALETVAYHLIKNALSFTPAHAEAQVEVRVRPEANTVLLEVRDSGVGMSKDELAHVFEPFYRADTSRNRNARNAGAGLGLTIVDEMVRQHGGTIAIESSRRLGTVAVVTLPRGGFISGSDDSRYTEGRSAESENGAHEPHGGRRHFTERDRVTKDIAGT